MKCRPGAAERRDEAAPAVDQRFRSARRADIAEPAVTPRSRELHQLRGGANIVGADIGYGPAGILAAPDGDEGIVAGGESVKLGIVELASEHETAVGEAKAV